MDKQFRELCDSSLIWLPEHGFGFYPVREADEPYRSEAGGAAYFAKYEGYADSERGEALTKFRVRFVSRHLKGIGLPLVDIGIGSGQFLNAWSGQATGYDINPAGKAWLHRAGRWCDWRLCLNGGLPAITCWDVLEHLPDPHALLAKVGGWVFTSLPIFTGPEHVLQSKHYRKDEHRHYFTCDGLVAWMKGYGFTCVEVSDGETDLGREDVLSFAFRRERAA